MKLIALLAVSNILLLNAATIPSKRGDDDRYLNSLKPPPGGINDLNPAYRTKSEFDWQSINLALNQEYIELDMFLNYAMRWSVQDWIDAGYTANDRLLVYHFGRQEIGHAQALNRILGDNASEPCEYQYPFKTIPEFVDFSQKLTRWGESGVYGFLERLNSRDSAQILLQSITTEARQQYTFRQMEGLFPSPEWFETGITQSMAWTLLHKYLKSCPGDSPKVKWNVFPALELPDAPNPLNDREPPAIAPPYRALSKPGRKVNLKWEAPGKVTGPDGKYITKTAAGKPKYAAWFSQFSLVYTDLSDLDNGSYTASTEHPGGDTKLPGVTFEGDPAVNGTVFIAIVDDNPYLTPANLSLIDHHIVAGPQLYIAG
ncbi:hypothetical protein FRC02_005193 [Tulasnella sp. 418]|nr:hypothetical protein FRC02_005193 [Tulasnella sp. 418]